MEGSEIFKCSDCQKIFVKRYQYNRHRKSHDKPYGCAFCGSRFGKKNDLDRHRLRHTASTPKFKCQYPGCSFRGTSRKDYLWSHTKKRHSNPDDGSLDGNPRSYYHRSQANEAQQSAQSLYDVNFLEVVAQGDEQGLIQLLSKSSMGISTKDSTGGSVLHVAARAGHQNTAKLLLQNGADSNAKDIYGRSILHDAARGGHEGITKLLLQNGADINAQDQYNESALDNAALGGHKSVTQLLLQNGANINVPSKSGTALQYAVMQGNVTMATPLLDSGANVNIASIYLQGTPLHMAARTSPEVTKLLLQANAAIEAKDGNGQTPLSYAIRRPGYPRSEFNEEATKLLFEAGAKFSLYEWHCLSPDQRGQFADYCPLPPW